MTKLYEITEAQAEAMSAGNAVKVLAEQKEREEEGYGEAWDRELSYYALDFDKDGSYVVVKWNGDVREAPTLWHHWSKILPEEKMMKLEVGEALSLRPEVRKILKKKVDDTIGKFESDAKPETKDRYKAASEETKAKILNAWLKSKGHPAMDAGRRRSRRGRKSRKTTRRR
jgi:hypothetical protein